MGISRVDEVRRQIMEGETPDKDELLWLCGEAEKVLLFANASECDPMEMAEINTALRRITGMLLFRPGNNIDVKLSDTFDRLIELAAGTIGAINYVIATPEVVEHLKSTLPKVREIKTVAESRLAIYPVWTVPKTKLTVFADNLFPPNRVVAGFAEPTSIKHKHVIWKMPFDTNPITGNKMKYLEQSVCLTLK